MITNMYPPHHLGGYELACRDAVHSWRTHGHEVVVLTSDIALPHASGADEPGVIRKLHMYWRENVILSPSWPERLRIERANLETLRRALEVHRPDVVSVWHMGALSLGLLTELARRDVPTVLVIGDQWLVYGLEVDAWMRNLRTRRSIGALTAWLTATRTTVEFSRDSAVLFATRWLRDRTEARSPLELPDRRAVVYGGIDEEVFASRQHHSFSWRLLLAGRVEPRKGVHVAVEALAQLPDDAVLDIVGSLDDDGYVAALRRRADELCVGDRVRFHGQVPRDELASRIGRADVFLFPVVWEEPFGMAPLEAMACGTAVVGTATGGSAEFLIDGVNSLRALPDDPRSLAANVRRLAADDVLRSRLIEAGKRTSRYFTNRRYNDELEAWHVAAAAHFTDGLPATPEQLEDVLASLDRDPASTTGQDGTLDV